jgi:glycosidase
MQWNDSTFAGFSTAKPWLPVHPNYTRRNVTSQQIDLDSLFHLTKKLLALRKEFPALCRGDFIPLETPRGVLAYLRQTEEQSVLVVLNFSGRKVKFSLPIGDWHMLLTTVKGAPGVLAPFEIQIFIFPDCIFPPNRYTTINGRIRLSPRQ